MNEIKNELTVGIETDSGEVVLPSIFEGGKLYNFKLNQLHFLDALTATGDLVEACKCVSWTPDTAKHFLSKPDVRAFLADRAKEIAIKRGMTTEWFLKSLYDVWNGDKKPTREQMDAIKEIGSRVSPKIEKVQHEFEDAEFTFVQMKKK